MNCVSEQCKYARSKVVKNDGRKYFKSVLVFECVQRESVSYPAIDDHKKDMRCKYYKRLESEDKE